MIGSCAADRQNMDRGPIQASFRLALTTDGPALSVSEGSEALLGFAPHHFLRGEASLRGLVHPHDAEIAEELFAPEGKQTAGVFNLRLRHASGRVVCVKGRYERQLDPSGGPVLDLLLQDATTVREHADCPLAANFKTLIEHTDDFISIKNRNHVYLAASCTLPRLTASAASPAAMIGKTDYDLYPEPVADAIYALEKQALAQGQCVHERQSFRARDGSTVWIDNRKYPMNGASGAMVGIFSIAPEITAIIEAEQALRQSNELLQLFVNHAPASLVMLDREMRHLAVSCRFLEAFNLQGQDTIGKSHYEVLPYLPEHWKKAHRRALAGETVRSDEESLLRSDGARMWTRWEVHPWRDSAGAIGGIVVFAEDITKRKKAEAALRESKDLLQLFIEHAPVPLAMFDREMRYLAISRLWAVEQSVDEHDILGRCHYEVIPDIPERWKETHRRGLGGETQRVEEDRYDRANGAVQWIRWQIMPWLAGDGSIGGIVMYYEDITARKQAEAALRESKDVLQLFIDRAPAALAMFDREMRYLAVSRRWIDDYGLEGRELIGRSHYEINPRLPERWKDSHRRGLAGETVRADEDPYELADGTVRWSRWEVTPWRTASGDVGGIILFAEDITRQKELEDRLRLAASVFTNASEGIVITDPHGTILDVNATFTRTTGYTRAEAVGRNPRILQSGLQSKEFYVNLWHALLEKGQWSGEVWNRKKNGDAYLATLSITAIRDAQGRVQQYVGLSSDVTSIKEQERQLERVAHYDLLTALPNRVLLADRLRQAMVQARRRGQLLAVAMLDLDGFKAVNDRHGKVAGDRLLSALAARMSHVLRAGDTLARLGGDEFAAVLIDLPDEAAGAPVLQALLHAASEQQRVGDVDLRVSASIGVTFYPQAEEVDEDLLLRQADQAMYQAKLAGRNRVHRFDPAEDLTIRGRHENLAHIRRAMAAREFVLYYQPKVNMRTGAVLGAEALIRWNHPERGILPPGLFLPVIDDHPLAAELGEWVIETALSQIEAWQKEGLEVPVSVNVGAFELQQPDFVDRLRVLLAAHPGVAPSSLELEVLESSALQDVAQTSHVLRACHDLGVSVALDDFGTGYSSLTYLKRLPVDVLKIDRSFVSDMLDDPEDLTILEGVLGLAAAFRRNVIAEGVETPEHGSMLLQLGCELAQGYGIARPMPAAGFAAWLAAWRPHPDWARVSALDPCDRALLYGGVEHRAWIASFDAYLEGERHMPPILDHRQCRFGAWLESDGHAARFGPSALHSVETTHRRLHSLAVDILALRKRGRAADSSARMPELYGLRDSLLSELEALRLSK